MHGMNKKLYLALILASTGGAAGAQDQDADDLIAACARIAAVGDRILCLENAVRDVADAPAASAATVEQTANDTPSGSETTDDQAVELANGMAGEPLIESAAGDIDRAAAGVAIAAETPAASTSMQAPDAATGSEPLEALAETPQETEPEPAIQELGAEQVRARTMTQEERLAELDAAENLRVASYSKVPFEKLVVELENGQVWRQIKGDVQKIRVDLKRNQTVTISESRFGGYRLRLNEIERTIRVQRIR